MKTFLMKKTPADALGAAELMLGEAIAQLTTVTRDSRCPGSISKKVGDALELLKRCQVNVEQIHTEVSRQETAVGKQYPQFRERVSLLGALLAEVDNVWVPA